MAIDPQLQRMFDQPLDFADDEQQKRYRRKAIMSALIIIVLSFLPLLIDAVLYWLSHIVVADGLNDASASYRSRNRQDGFIIVWYGVFFVGLPYGIYRLVTLRKRMQLLARKDLMVNHPELAKMDEIRKHSLNQRLNNSVGSFSNGLVKFFRIVIGVMITVIIVGVIVVLISHR